MIDPIHPIPPPPRPTQLAHRLLSQATWSRARHPGSQLTRCHARLIMSETKNWVHNVKTVSTFPPEGLFTKDAQTIAKAMASKKVSPKGIGSGIRMIQFFINRAGKNLDADRKRELEKAKRILQAMPAKKNDARSLRKGGESASQEDPNHAGKGNAQASSAGEARRESTLDPGERVRS
jgi:tRNA(adenine34) deaminase